MKLSRESLKNLFLARKKPSQEDFANLIDSMAHLDEDSSSMGLGAHNPAALYLPGSIILQNGLLLASLIQQQGPYVKDNWEMAISAGVSNKITTNQVVNIYKNFQYEVRPKITCDGKIVIDGVLIISDFGANIKIPNRNFK